MNRTFKTAGLLVLGMSLVGLPGCGSGKPRINGAGATFIYPMMSKWASEYDKVKGVEVNYQSIGSGGGIQQMTAKTADFGSTDGPMNDEQLQKAKDIGGEVVHIPLAMGAVVPAYNLEGVTEPLTFTGPLLADIFLGKIKKWNDNAIRDQNPNVILPDKDIGVVHRSDGSGTTYVWVDYLSKVSPEWKKKIGVATSVNWPVGEGAKGNEGVAKRVKETPGALGYIELIYALQVSHRRCRQRPEGYPRRPPLFDHRRRWQGFLPHQRNQLGSHVRQPTSQEGPIGRRLPSLGNSRRPAILRRAALRKTAIWYSRARREETGID
jgi:ABC-type phosphate transport system substrate-binding protein